MITGVVKIGGAAGNNPAGVLGEIVERFQRGEKWVLVHGVSFSMDTLCRAVDIEPKYVISPTGFRSRFVGHGEMTLFEAASLAETSRLCSMLVNLGVPAVPVDPISSGIVMAETKECIREMDGDKILILRGNRSGRVVEVRTEELDRILENGFLPVIPPLARDIRTKKSVNVDGDRAAASIAGAMRAEILVLLTNVPGILHDPADPGSLIKRVVMGEWETVEKAAKGNMKRKVLACKEALEHGVPAAIIADSRVDLPVSSAIGEGGTRFCRAEFTGIAV